MTDLMDDLVVAGWYPDAERSRWHTAGRVLGGIAALTALVALMIISSI